MTRQKTSEPKEARTKRPPVVVVMGHIDHGKSTLLDYIRKTNVVGTEAGGITQRISAYEVVHKDEAGANQRITFLDTPGHEAFQKMRLRGAEIADIAILVVSAEEGVKPQTLEALACIKRSDIPYIVAINKIDKPNANVERTKQSLLEHEIYLEGMGGDIPYVPVSAKRGDGVPELLDMTLLIAALRELTGEAAAPAEGVVIESHLDPKRGMYATLIIKNGTLRTGEFAVSGESVAPVRAIEDFTGKKIEGATFSSPIRIVGWSTLPAVGAPFASFKSKREAERAAKKPSETKAAAATGAEETRHVVPVILKADVVGTLEAIEHELAKLDTDRVRLKVIQKNVGSISESDIKTAASVKGTLVIGFNVKADAAARDLAEREGIEISIFDIIYKLSEWLAEVIAKRTPKVTTESISGAAKVLKRFSQSKDKQVIGCRVENGVMTAKTPLRIMRRGVEIGRGAALSLEQNKSKVSKVEAGEFGAQVESKFEIAPGDILEIVTMVTS